jgi:hypothetical protein
LIVPFFLPWRNITDIHAAPVLPRTVRLVHVYLFGHRCSRVGRSVHDVRLMDGPFMVVILHTHALRRATPRLPVCLVLIISSDDALPFTRSILNERCAFVVRAQTMGSGTIRAAGLYGWA